MNLNKKVTEEQIRNYQSSEISNEQIFNEFVDDVIQLVRKSNTSKKGKFNAYVKRKEREADRYESQYKKYKKMMLSSDKSRDEVFEKLEKAYDILLEMREDIQILKNYS
tara:strand:+ start:58 stop:384 length:327 start_codon:yes stop_codon:yes gene_type:complete